MADRTDNCYKCKHRRNVTGNSHISCANPDPEMRGKATGIKHGWFHYPGLFDPVWKDKECSNFEERPA